MARAIGREKQDNQKWVRLVARLSKRSYEQALVLIREFVGTDVFSVSVENSVPFLEPLIESWDIDLNTLAVELVLNRSLTPGNLKRFAFVEQQPEPPFDIEPGLEEFLKNSSLSSDATGEEVVFLKKLRFEERRPTALYYYRELQNLRDPLHFFSPQTKRESVLPARRRR